MIPATLQDRVIQWYHKILCHPGIKHTEFTTRQNFTWSTLTRDVQKFVSTCDCQRYKTNPHKYGPVPAREVTEANVTPWHTVCVDCAGPYSLMTRIQGKRKQIHLRVLTMIDLATSYFHITQIKNVTAETTALAFDRTWLSRFPRPFRCLHDSGNEFVGKEFQQLLTSYSIKDVCAATRNPQMNAILERMHAVLTNSLQTFKLDEQVLDVNNPWEGFLAATRFAINSTYHTVNEATPGQLVFGRDMIMPTVFHVNWRFYNVVKPMLPRATQEKILRVPNMFFELEIKFFSATTHNKLPNCNVVPLAPSLYMTLEPMAWP